MKIKNKCHILGWIDHDNQYHLDEHLSPCFNKNDIDCAVIDNLEAIKNAKSHFLLESVKEKNIRPGYQYYYLSDTFGAGFRDAPLHKYKKSYVNKNIFTIKTKNRMKELFNFYWEIDVLDEILGNDQRCCFKIVPIKLEIIEHTFLTPQTEYHFNIR